MKKIVAGAVVVSCLSVAGLAAADIATDATANKAGAGVINSYHDMTKVVPATADVMGRVCVYCHAPHHAQKDDLAGVGGFDNYPLWNHKFSTQNFTAYTWATPLNASGAIIGDVLAGPSRLCMTCHDGSVAIDEHGTTMGNGDPNNGTKSQAGNTTTPNYIQTRANLTNDLSNTHPIGFSYVGAVSARNTVAGHEELVTIDQKYASAILPSTGDTGQYANVTRNAGSKTIGDNLYGGTIMTCATCHEVHNKENVVQDAFSNDPTKKPNYFLYAKESQSLICLSCHIK